MLPGIAMFTMVDFAQIHAVSKDVRERAVSQWRSPNRLSRGLSPAINFHRNGTPVLRRNGALTQI